MKKDPGLTFRLFLMLSDACAIIFSFAFAYFIRTHLTPRPYYFTSEITQFTLTIALLVPIWLTILALFGLYQKNIFMARSRLPETLRLFVASIVGVMTLITYDFFAQGNLFPTRLIAIYSMILCFFSLFILRGLIRLIRRHLLKVSHRGAVRVIIIGNSKNTTYLAEQMTNFPDTGYFITGIVANSKYIPKKLRKYQYSSLKEALKKARPDAIFQTDERQANYVYKQAIQRHLLYYFVPSETMLSSHFGQPELIGNPPAILVKTTPLIGEAKIVKRFLDLLFGSLATIVALPIMCVIWLAIKLTEPKHPATYIDYRLSRYNRRFKLYKFRSMKPEYSGLTPEEAFTKMGKPELIKKYRDNGDFLENDPRITKIGRFIRATSLDELPQLFNVVKGDISLVGPRALIPGELRHYGDRSLLLSVKSGLTGLAQVSGRRDISFDERRALDIYYIQNWSLLLDLQIIARTFVVVLTGKGAK